MDLFGLISVIDDTYFGSEQAFRAEFGGREEVASQALLARRLEPICKRTLRRQVQKAGLINYTKHYLESTLGYLSPMNFEEARANERKRLGEEERKVA